MDLLEAYMTLSEKIDEILISFWHTDQIANNLPHVRTQILKAVDEELPPRLRKCYNMTHYGKGWNDYETQARKKLGG